MAQNMTKGHCNRLIPDELCPECKRKGIYYIGCEIHPGVKEPDLTWEDVDHFYYCDACGKQWSNLIYFI